MKWQSGLRGPIFRRNGERTLKSIHVWQGTDCCSANEERVGGNYNVVTYEEDDKGLGLKMKMKFEEMKKVD